MASYRLNASVVKGSQEGSVVLKAAYRAAEKLTNHRTNDVYDYRRKRGVVHAEIMLPEDTDPQLQNRETFWNTVEQYELGKRRDAQLAREVVISLPHEMNDDERLALTRNFVREQFVSQGMGADIALHRPQKDKGEDIRNHHAHILLTLRQVGKNGLRAVKTREWNSDKTLKDWREQWAVMQNDALERGGHRERVDHRSLKQQRAAALAQGQKELAAALDREPEIHVGPQARQIERNGFPVASRNRERVVYGRQRRQQRTRQVRYQEFDQGTRAAYNGRLVARKADNVRQAMRKLERHQARLQRHLRRYQKMSSLVTLQQQDLMQRVKEQRRRQTLLDMLERRKEMATGRAALVEMLIDKLIREMLTMRTQEDRALSRFQSYQLKMMFHHRRIDKEQRLRQQAGQRRERELARKK